MVYLLKKIKKYKAEIRELRTAVIAHEKHLRGAESATELAIKNKLKLMIKNMLKKKRLKNLQIAFKKITLIGYFLFVIYNIIINKIFYFFRKSIVLW
ncbi:hypothetical protein SCITRI_00959 [Spiroplasma citri]|nr:hypothetical protein SCITRI_00959 [Spiroplasma citri]